jgi:pimeloyl-ACP methyl ester carboxylesterase
MIGRRYRFRGEVRALDDEARATAPGEFVTGSDGLIQYEMAGPAQERLVVLVPGFSIPCHLWDPTFKALAEAGFQVLRYNLYGRGFSDRPDVVYDRALFERQLLSLLSALNKKSPVDLVGVSMGGAIAVGLTDRYPDRVRKLGLIDPAGLPMPAAFSKRLAKAPLIGEWLMDLWGDRILVDDIPHDFHRPEAFREYQAQYLPQMEFIGFKRAVLSTLRHGPLENMAEAFRRVGAQNRPIWLIWGRHDRTLPFENSERVRALLPQAEFHAVEEAGHVPHYEHPEVVNPMLIDFLRR